MPFDMVPFFILIAAHAVLFGLSVPLALGRVQRNNWYGFRTPSTVSRDEVWYPVNAAYGVIQSVLVGLSLLVMVGGMLVQPAERWIQVGVIGLIAGTFISIGYALVVLQRAKANPSPGSR